MKKVAICTIDGNSNYGNRLQNYAVQEVLKSKHCMVETIENRKKFMNNVFLDSVKSTVAKIVKKTKLKKEWARTNNFNAFQKKIKVHNVIIDKDYIPENISKEFDCFFTGSDQVWNPYFGRISDIDFLTFTEKRKRNAISASFGIDDLPENMKQWYINNLNGLNNISVREENAKRIIEEATGRKDVVVLLDPTMLLTSKEWKKVSKKPKQLNNEKYILNYFLGELSDERKNMIDSLAKKCGFRVINILDKNDPFYVSGPSEFLYLEENAELICTDSFHSAVFSILFNTPFMVFDRKDKNANMNSRLDTLLKKFKFEDRFYKGKLDISDLNCDFSHCEVILKEERKKADSFLERVLENDK